jgi:hypothetical protein
MYRWIWRQLPEPLAVRITTAVVLTAVMTWVLMALVFPWLETVWLVDRPELFGVSP